MDNSDLGRGWIVAGVAMFAALGAQKADHPVISAVVYSSILALIVGSLLWVYAIPKEWKTVIRQRLKRTLPRS